VAKGDQTITFGVLPDKTFGDPDYSLSASASSGLSVNFVSSNSSVATVAGTTVHIAGAGTTVMTASQSGNSLWNPAPDVPQTLTVNKANQTITFSILSDNTFGDPDYSLSASASSGLNVNFSSSNSSVATVTGSTVHIVGAGTTIITASQPGDANYNPAPDVPQTLTVNKADQTIAFSVLSDKTFGDGDYAISAIASSGLNVNYSSSNIGVATVTGNTVYIVGAGTTIITASQPGDANYNPAPDVPQTLTVNKADQTITFTVLSDKTFGDGDYTISANASSGLSVNFSSSNIGVATVTGNTVHIVAPGTAVITASQPGDANYNPAPDVPQTLTVNKANQTITFTDAPDSLLVSSSFTLAATNSSGLTVYYESSDNNLATISGSQVTGVSKGTVQIRAYNDGDENYEAAEAFVTVEVYSTHRDIMYLFTPNTDGINDHWELPEMQAWGNCDVKVYNRWGKLVYADKNYNNEWDGMSDGYPLPEGAYYFVIKTANAGTVKGTVNIVR
jgi:gliding motility-associated-like protein